MGSEKVEDNHTSFLSRACRLPRKIADRVGELSDTIYKEHLKPLRSESDFPYRFISTAILLLLFLPAMLMFTYVIPPEVELVPSSQISNVTTSDYRQVSEVGVTNAVLLNNTPFYPGDDWEIDTSLAYPDYDINRHTSSEVDGYHLEFVPNELAYIFFGRFIQIPILNYSDISIIIEVEKVSGSAGIYLEVFANEEREMVESTLETNQIIQLNASAALARARQDASSWLGSLHFIFRIGASEGAEVIIHRVVIEATFTAKLSHVQIDVQNTENVSLYENPMMKYLESPPQIILVRNNDTDSVARYSPIRANDEIYLPPGTYEGMAYWHFFGQERPDPNNATSWHPNVKFTVLDDTALEVDIKLFTIRLNIDLSPDILLSDISILFMEHYQYSLSQNIIGFTLYDSLPDYFYIPGGVGSLYIWLNTWSPFNPRWGWDWRPTQGFQINAQTYLDMSNSSTNLKLNIVLPFATIGNVVLGLGDFLLLIVEGYLFIGAAVTLHRALRYSELRHRLSDSRLIPIVLLGLSVFLPWSMQLVTFSSPPYDGVYWISWFSMPFMIRWTDSTAIQIICATADWWNATLISTFFLFIPLFLTCLSLSSPEKEGFDRAFALVLFLPYLVVKVGFDLSVLTLDTISIGPLLVLAALPVWLVRIALRRFGITK
ncbi:MAG: hypothetical protein ACFFDV_03250 [Candidatus Thorarchaeota archaeon]